MQALLKSKHSSSTRKFSKEILSSCKPFEKQKHTRKVEDKPVLSRLRHFTNTAQDVSKGSNLDSEETKMHTGSPRPESHRLKMFRSSSSKDFPMKTEKIVR